MERTQTLASGSVIGQDKRFTWLNNFHISSAPPSLSSSSLPFLTTHFSSLEQQSHSQGSASLHNNSNSSINLNLINNNNNNNTNLASNQPKSSKITKTRHKNARPYLAFNVQTDIDLIRQKAADRHARNAQRLVMLMSYYESKMQRLTDEPTCCGISYKQLEEEEKSNLEKRLNNIKKCSKRIEKLLEENHEISQTTPHHPRKFFTQL